MTFLFLSAALSSPGQTFVLALYVEPIMAGLQVSRAAVSIWYTVATLVAAAMLMPFGHLADRVSTRRFLLLVMGLIAVGVAVLASAMHPLQVLGGFVLLRLAGQGAIGVGLLTAVIRRFPLRTGRPLSLASLGYSAGEIVFPFLVTSAIALVGWRESLAFIAVAYVAVAMPILARGLSGPMGAVPPAAAPRTSPGIAGSAADALRQPIFWVALIAFSVLPIAVTALFFHQVAILRLAGIDDGLVPLAFALYAVSYAIGTAVLGRVIDAMSPRVAAIASGVGMLAAVGALLLPVPALITVSAYAALLGFSAALAALAGALVWPLLFGALAVGRIRAASTALRNCATAAGPLLIAIPLSANVVQAVIPLFAVAIAGLLAAFWLPRGRRFGDGGRGAGCMPFTAE